jgi:hypothetical protein
VHAEQQDELSVQAVPGAPQQMAPLSTVPAQMVAPGQWSEGQVGPPAPRHAKTEERSSAPKAPPARRTTKGRKVIHEVCEPCVQSATEGAHAATK